MKETAGRRRETRTETNRSRGTVPKSATRRQPPGGSRKGKPNKTTAAVREMFAEFVGNNLDRVQELFDKTARRNPARALELLSAFAEFCVPKLSRVELQDETPRQPPVMFQITFPDGGPGQGRQGSTLDGSSAALLGSADDGIEVSGPEGDMGAPLALASPATPEEPIQAVEVPASEAKHAAARPPVVVDAQTSQVASLALFEQFGRPSPPPDAMAGTRAREAAAARTREQVEARIERENAKAREQAEIRARKMRDEGWGD